MDKIQMAMRFAEIMLIEHFKGSGIYNSYGYKDGICEDAWVMADAMQAEADKRKPSGLPEALREEWQPDWSQAPDGFNYFCVGSEGGYGFFSKQEPELCGIYYFVGNDGFVCKNHSYQGNWQDSLRRRPHDL